MADTTMEGDESTDSPPKAGEITDEDVQRAFKKCPDCGRWTVRAAPHVCSNPKERPTVVRLNGDQREARRQRDTNPDDTLVVTSKSGSARCHTAYHRPAPADPDVEHGKPHVDRTPLFTDETDIQQPVDVVTACPANLQREDSTWIARPRKDAKRRGNYPCLICFPSSRLPLDE